MKAGIQNSPDRPVLRRSALVGVGALSLALGGCSLFGVQVGGGPSPASVTPTVAATSATPTPTPTTTTPTPTPTMASPSKAAVKATGNLNFYSEVSSAMTGTCSMPDGQPTIVVSDEANDFFETVSLTLVLTTGKDRLVSMAVDTGQDSEEITWHLSYDPAKPAKGTSAKLVVNGSTYRVSGSATTVEINADGAKTTEIVPFGITVKCADVDW